MEKKLAIIIPAYKPDFLEKALNSIDNQINKNFQLYIGNDGSPHDLYAICRPFVEKNGWKYHSFVNNLGGENLVAHWNRCVALSTEEWIWLFSDDDEMAPDCVEGFYETLKLKPDSRVLKFDFSIINGYSVIIKSNEVVFKELAAFEFGRLRFERKLLSSVVEFIFTRDSFLRAGGFINFPAGWCSDDASWIAFSGNLPIRFMERGRVFWRISDVNISGSNEKFRKHKTDAAIAFITWFNYRFPKPAEGNLFGEQMIWLRVQLVQNKTTPGFFDLLRILIRLSPASIPDLLHTINELFFRNRMIQNQLKGEPSSFIFYRISNLLGKF